MKHYNKVTIQCNERYQNEESWLKTKYQNQDDLLITKYQNEEGWLITKYQNQEGWLATANVRGVVGVTYTTR